MAQKKKNTKKLDNLKLADGKAEAIKKIQELEEILGMPTVNPFAFITTILINSTINFILIFFGGYFTFIYKPLQFAWGFSLEDPG